MYSRTRCRAQASQWVQSRLGAEVFSGPLFASAVGRRFKLCSNLLSVVLMKDYAQRSGRSPPDWLKTKISNAPAVKREAEESGEDCLLQNGDNPVKRNCMSFRRVLMNNLRDVKA